MLLSNYYLHKLALKRVHMIIILWHLQNRICYLSDQALFRKVHFSTADKTIQHHNKKSASKQAFDISEYNPYKDDDIYSKCGKTYGCYGIPSNCIGTRSCSILVTFAQRSNGDVKFGLIAKDFGDKK